MRHTRPVRWLAGLAGLAAAWMVAACAAGPPSAAQATALPPSPVGSLKAGPNWLAARVEQPAAIEAAPTDAPVFCSPCHPVIGTYIDSLVAFHGGFLAFGHDQPPSHAAAWASDDGTAWRRVASLPAPDASIISAAVTETDGAVLAVGESGGAAAVWRSDDGAAWTLTTLAAPRAAATEWLTSVAITSDGYVAGGYEESSTAQRTASFWHSPDGVNWVRGTAQVPAGASEVTGVAVIGTASIMAVGIAGDERSVTAAVWRSSDGGTNWQAVSSPAFAAGRMLAVVGDGNGAVAVGEGQDQTGAAAWYSPDGLTWVSASGAGLDNYGLQVVMTAVTADGSGFVAAGGRSDAGNGSAVVWQSTDGRSWVHLPQDASFSGAGLSCVLGSPRLLLGGTTGWPDTHAAEVWVAQPG
ncbi:MAG: hypothetical protein ABSG37_12470 [Candidatus Limnocylindrales bacterium]